MRQLALWAFVLCTTWLASCVLMPLWSVAAATLNGFGSDSFPPPRPVLPLQFRAKAKVWLGADPTPVLLLYHHDDVGHRSREDYYHLVGSKHTRFYTSIKLQEKGQNFMILHKQPRSPRACFITPLLAPLFNADALETAVYVGPATVQWWSKHVDGERDAAAAAQARAGEPEAAAAAGAAAGAGASAAAGGAASASASASAAPLRELGNQTCAHWRLSYEGERVELCVHPRTGAPVLLHHPFIRAHVLDWAVLSASGATSASAPAGGSAATAGSPTAFSAGLFDPARASVAPCAPFGASTSGSSSRGGGQRR